MPDIQTGTYYPTHGVSEEDKIKPLEVTTFTITEEAEEAPPVPMHKKSKKAQDNPYEIVLEPIKPFYSNAVSTPWGGKLHFEVMYPAYSSPYDVMCSSQNWVQAYIGHSSLALLEDRAKMADANCTALRSVPSVMPKACADACRTNVKVLNAYLRHTGAKAEFYVTKDMEYGLRKTKEFTKPEPRVVKTQKVQGFMMMSKSHPGGLAYSAGKVTFPHSDVILNHAELKQHELAGFPYFARPCPIKPRHGFVDSRVVRNMGDVSDLFKEARKEDPKAELMLMPLLRGRYSAVVTPAGIAIGRGHDGATSGEDASFLPCPVGKLAFTQEALKWPPSKLESAGVLREPYIEIVEDNGGLAIVQLRDGPTQIASLNYLPNKVKVKCILLRPNDTGEKNTLLGWEKSVKWAKDNFKPSEIVFHNKHGSLCDHYSIHAIEAGIGVVTDATTDVHDGAILEQDKGLKVSRSKGDLYRAAGYLAGALLTKQGWLDDYLTNWSKTKHEQTDEELDQQWFAERLPTLYTAVSISHMAAHWSLSGRQAVLWAYAAAAIFEYAAAACIGELRHFNTNGPGSDSNDESKPSESKPSASDFDRLFAVGASGKSCHRDAAYSTAVDLEFSETLDALKLAVKDFRTGGWSSSYGGKAWATCTEYAIALGVAIAQFTQTPSRANWGACLNAMNTVVHVSHNGGKMLTKWITKDAMGNIAAWPISGILNPFAFGVASGYTHIPLSSEDRSTFLQQIKETK